MASLVGVAELYLPDTDTIRLKALLQLSSDTQHLMFLTEIGLLRLAVNLLVVGSILANLRFDVLFLTHSLGLFTGHSAEGTGHFFAELQVF